ncbi:hypothetical protein GCM10028820_33660 [Tessaracoccus terricola]
MLVLAFVVLVALVSATTVLARPKDTLPRNTATSLLPPDGHREVQRGDGSVTVREYAFNSGGAMVNSGPMELVLAFSDPESVLETSFLRLLETTASGDDVRHSVTALELGDWGVRRNLDVSGGVIQHWVPAPLLLPADVEPGTTWRSTGSLNTYEDFQPTGTERFDFSASATLPNDPEQAAEGCLDVTTVQTIGEAEETRTETWCPGRGVVAGGWAAADSPNPTDPGLGVPANWDPQRWEADVVDLNKSEPMVWSSMLARVGTDEALVVAHQTTGDLLIAPDGDVDRAVRAHPGGSIVALASFGDLVVAATSQATVAAYDIRGVWQWETKVPDIVSLSPALADGLVVVADGSGNVTGLQARTGERAWTTSLPNQPVSAPEACGSTTLVGTTGATLVMLDEHGRELATADLSDRSTRFACGVAGEVYSAGTSFLERIDASGSVLVRRHMHDALIDEVHHFDDVVVTASGRAITAYDDETLERLWRVDGDFFDTAMADDSIIAIDTERLMALDLQGREVASWPSDAARDGFTTHVVPFSAGVGVVSPELQLTRLR